MLPGSLRETQLCARSLSFELAFSSAGAFIDVQLPPTAQRGAVMAGSAGGTAEKAASRSHDRVANDAARAQGICTVARGTVLIDVDRCKGCRLCTTVCPQGVLQMSRNGYNARGYRPVVFLDPEGKCTGCALCAWICPDVVFTVYRSSSKPG